MAISSRSAYPISVVLGLELDREVSFFSVEAHSGASRASLSSPPTSSLLVYAVFPQG